MKEGFVSKSASRKSVSRRKDVSASRGHGKVANKKQSQAVKDHLLEAEAIERAVYDGMQDLRATKPG